MVYRKRVEKQIADIQDKSDQKRMEVRHGHEFLISLYTLIKGNTDHLTAVGWAASGTGSSCVRGLKIALHGVKGVIARRRISKLSRDFVYRIEYHIVYNIYSFFSCLKEAQILRPLFTQWCPMLRRTCCWGLREALLTLQADALQVLLQGKVNY